jgi:two-component system phosphate regulon response regulator OmpR
MQTPATHYFEPDVPPHVLIVDDDDKLRALLDQFLTTQGFITTVAESAKQARAVLELIVPDVIVLDVMMPEEKGTTLAKELRAQQGPPVLLLTALGESENRIEGLEAGADDYVTKPFEPKELVLRLKNMVSRTQKPAALRETILHFGAFSFSPKGGKLMRGAEVIYLTSSELGCLRALAEAAGKPLSREQLAAASMETHGGNTRSVDVQINRLRKKIEANPSKPIYIQTVRHAGYALMIDTYAT